MTNPNDSNYDYLFKILLIGDTAVGKSSLLVRFTEDIFTDTYMSTIGVDFKVRTIKLDEKTIKLQIWDTAGQERFRNITSSYYRGANGVMIIYNVNNQKTFNNARYWLDEVAKYADPNINKLLVGNKADNPSMREVEYNRGREFADSQKISFVETSAKNANNVNRAFLTIIAEMKDRLGTNKKQTQGIKLSEPDDKCKGCVC